MALRGKAACVRIRVWLAVAAMLGLAARTPVGGRPGGLPQCRPDGPVAAIAELPEASGIAVSRRVPGAWRAHNDSGQPVLFALDARGSVTGRVRLSGVTLVDWRPSRLGRAQAGRASTSPISGTTAPRARASRSTVFRSLPGLKRSVAVTDVLQRPRTPTARTTPRPCSPRRMAGSSSSPKAMPGPWRCTGFRETCARVRHIARRIGQPRGSGTPGKSERITDGAVSGKRRMDGAAHQPAPEFHRAAELLAGNWRVALGSTLPLSAIAGGGSPLMPTLWTRQARAGASPEPGTFARLNCSASS